MRLPNGYGGVAKLSGKRRKPYMVRKTVGWHYDHASERNIQEYQIIGYTRTRAEGLQLLAQYNFEPVTVEVKGYTFGEVYEMWGKSKFPAISHSNVLGYQGAYKLCHFIADKPIADLHLADLQFVVDTCGKNYPILKKLNVLFHQVYDYAMKNELVEKDYSQYVDIGKFRNRNPNKQERNRLPEYVITKLWEQIENPDVQIILMLIYSGVRVSELLNLKKENVHLEEQYFDVIESKTQNGIRQVPIADKVLSFYEDWYEGTPSCEYLLHTPKEQPFLYRNYYLHYFKPVMDELHIEVTCHCCRHTCISMLAEAHVDQTLIKKIVGHSAAMSLTEKVYTHFEVQDLLEAINKI